MNPIFEAALEMEGVCRDARFSFCFIGGLAVQRWGAPRMTVDVDLTLITGFGSEGPFVDVLLGRFRGRLDDTRDFALRHRTLLLVASNGTHLDVSLGAMPFEERTVARASGFAVSQADSLTTCSAEDLVVHKAFAGRDKDWADIATIADRQRGRLDEALVWSELEPLLELKNDRATAPRLRSILRSGAGDQ